jgi:hypothetical protein
LELQTRNAEIDPELAGLEELLVKYKNELEMGVRE